MRKLLKRINTKNKRLQSAVSEVVGTILLLSISIALFSVVYIAFFSIQPSTPSPSSNIIASVEGNNIIFEHRSGEPLSLDTRIIINIGGNKYEVPVNLILQDTNGDGLWNVGERAIYNATDIGSLQTEATVIDVKSNSIIMQGVLKKGLTIEKPYVVTKPVISFSSHTAQLSMNYNFKNYSGYLRFLYKTSSGDWIVAGESSLKTGWGTYNCTINDLIPNTVYYFKAQLEYESETIDGIQLQFFTLGLIVGEWHFNSGSGTIAIDSSGHENNGTLYNKPQWTTDKINGSYALSFDGIDDYVLVSDSDSLDLTNNISIEAWIKPLDHSNGSFGDIGNSAIDISEFGIMDCLEHDIVKVYDNIYAIALRGTNNKGFLVTVEITNDGQINNLIIDKLEFDSTLCYKPKLLKINNSNNFIIIYTGSLSHGFIKTVEIKNNGLINDSILSVLEFDTSACRDPNIIHIADFVYAITYTGFGNNGTLKTIEITDDGQINKIIDTSVFDIMSSTQTYAAKEFEITHLNDSIYIICYRNKDNDGELRTVRIENDGTIINDYHTYPEGYYINSFLFDRDDGWTPDIIRIYDNIFAIAYGGFESPSQDGWLKTVKISYDGNSFEVIDSLEYDTNYGMEQNFIKINGNIYAVVYRGYGNDGFLKTVEILSNGQITDSVIDSFQFDTLDCYRPRIICVDQNIYAIVYTSTYNNGYLKTINISNDGHINKNVIDDLEIGIFNYIEPNIIHISDNIYAVVYRGLYDDGYVRTFEINNNGLINDNTIDVFEFDTQNCFEPNITHISGCIYAIAYRGGEKNYYGSLKTIEILNNGIITKTVIDNFVFDKSRCYKPEIIHVSGSVYAIAYHGPSYNGYLKTVTIENNGAIIKTIIDVLRFDTSRGYDPNIIKINNSIFAIAYRGVSNYGYLRTVEILSNGQITDSVIDSLTFINTICYDPKITSIFNDIYAIAYACTTSGGYISTVKIDDNGLIDDNVLDTLRFDNINNPSSDAYCYEPDIIHINDRILAITYRGQFNGYLKTLRIGENGDITNQNDDTYKYSSNYYEPNIIRISDDIYAITFRLANNYDGYVITINIKETQSIGRVIEKAGAYKIYANNTTVFAYINSMQLQASISQGFNYIVLTYDKNVSSNNLKLYVNAVEIINTTFSESINVNNNHLYFGGFNCIVDEIIIHELVLNTDEITQHYNDLKP